MPLLRGMARTAVVAGTATAVSNRVSRRQAQRWGAQDTGSGYEPEAQPAPPPAPPPPEPEPDPIARLKDLGELHASGVLTDEEFVAAKRQVLG
jgi:hypothetical protein